MNLFKCKTGFISVDEFSEMLRPLSLANKNVIVYSRLLSLGRFLDNAAVGAFINVLKSHIGAGGTLSIPSYTLNSYKHPRIFDLRSSKIMSGVLGVVAAEDSDFKRTIHPIYSNCIYGKFVPELMQQDSTTCFGENSFFDIFSKLENSYILMVGLNFNGPTLYHYYDQKFAARGRLVKDFLIKMILDKHEFVLRFNSYVKNYDFYHDRMNCLARFDALAEELNFVQHVAVGDDYIHGIEEIKFQALYKAALEIDQDHFLMGSSDEWENYFMKNNFRMFHNTINPIYIEKIKQKLGQES